MATRNRNEIETYPETNLMMGSIIGNGITIAVAFSIAYIFFFDLQERGIDPLANLTGVPIAVLIFIAAPLYIIYENKINNIFRKLFKRG
ncbi:MAG: hypothetical protein KKB21_05865 [Nanoarchaeota archaeon]|nr:hypothetical protein [Nanoarchaeota archaeon]